MCVVDGVSGKPLHADVTNDELKVFGNLHVVDLKMNRMLRENLASTARVPQDRERSQIKGASGLKGFHHIW